MRIYLVRTFAYWQWAVLAPGVVKAAESGPGNWRQSEEDLEGKQPSHSPRNSSSHCVASTGDNQKHMALPSLNTALT